MIVTTRKVGARKLGVGERSRGIYPLNRMEVGEEFYFDYSKIDNLCNATWYQKKRYGRVFETRKISEYNGICRRVQ